MAINLMDYDKMRIQTYRWDMLIIRESFLFHCLCTKQHHYRTRWRGKFFHQHPIHSVISHPKWLKIKKPSTKFLIRSNRNRNLWMSTAWTLTKLHESQNTGLTVMEAKLWWNCFWLQNLSNNWTDFGRHLNPHCNALN